MAEVIKDRGRWPEGEEIAFQPRPRMLGLFYDRVSISTNYSNPDGYWRMETYIVDDEIVPGRIIGKSDEIEWIPVKLAPEVPPRLFRHRRLSEGMDNLVAWYNEYTPQIAWPVLRRLRK